MRVEGVCFSSLSFSRFISSFAYLLTFVSSREVEEEEEKKVAKRTRNLLSSSRFFFPDLNSLPICLPIRNEPLPSTTNS